MRAPRTRRAGLTATLAAATATVALLPGAVGAQDATSLAELRERATSLEGRSQAALLELYALESSLARAREQAATLAATADRLERAEESARLRAEIARRSLTASQERVAEALRTLYIEGDADPIAVVLGATSLDEALAGIEGLVRATEQNRRLAGEARAKAVRLERLARTVGERGRAARAAHAGAQQALGTLQATVHERRALVDTLERDELLTRQRVAALVSEARAAERSSATRASVEVTEQPQEQPATAATPAAPVAPEPVSPPAAGSRRLTVDAVAYSLPGRTASGLPVGPGIVAVDPSVIPLGTRMFIPGYGPGVAADTGSAIKGLIIDLWFPTLAQAQAWGRRTVTITVYG